jgi:hypothetical protein
MRQPSMLRLPQTKALGSWIQQQQPESNSAASVTDRPNEPTDGCQTPRRHQPTDRPPAASDQPTDSSPQRQIAAATPLPPKIVTAPSDLFDNNKPSNSIFISPPVAATKWDPIKNGKLPTVPRDEDCNIMIPGGLTNLLKRQKEQNERAMENITPRQKLCQPYIADPMGLPFMTSVQRNKKEEEDWCREHIPNWCKGIMETNGHIIKNANNDVDVNMIPYINEDDRKQLYKVPQRRMKSDKTYAREDLDLACSLCRNAAAVAAAATSAEASIMD